jgi:SAM-dependent methyltransferase
VASSHPYVHFDELGGLPAAHRDNYLFELDYLVEVLPSGSSVLQVGSMDGVRILRLLERRPDLTATGLEINAELVALAEKNVQDTGKDVRFIRGDITDLELDVGRFDAVVCLNNTLGYISDYRAALKRMRTLGRVFVSVFGEAFSDVLAGGYFPVIGAEVHAVTGDEFNLGNFGVVRRFSRPEVESWRGRVLETPLGYLIEIT